MFKATTETNPPDLPKERRQNDSFLKCLFWEKATKHQTKTNNQCKIHAIQSRDCIWSFQLPKPPPIFPRRDPALWRASTSQAPEAQARSASNGEGQVPTMWDSGALQFFPQKVPARLNKRNIYVGVRPRSSKTSID